MKLLKKCRECGAYTMRGECPACGVKTFTAHPAKYAPHDKYARYRRQYKRSRESIVSE